jgi:uncharacterized membrane protein
MPVTDNEQNENADDSLPFAAPCNRLSADAPLRWLALGWQDIRRAPRQSLTYGFVMVIMSYLVSFLAWEYGNIGLLLSLLSGFVFMGPVLAIGLYSISYQLHTGRKPVLGFCLRQGIGNLSNELIFAVILLIVFLVWARAASMVHVFFPMESKPALSDMAMFLGIGTAIGSIFTAIIFCISAFSLPMIMDRKVDTITAVITSVNAVLRNRLAMLVWALLIVGVVLVGFATAFLGFMVLLPLIGHATWHGYRETVDASAWPVSQH